MLPQGHIPVAPVESSRCADIPIPRSVWPFAVYFCLTGFWQVKVAKADVSNTQCLFLRTSQQLSSVLLFFPSIFQLAFRPKCLVFNLSSPNLFVFQLLMPPVKFHWFHMLYKIHEKKNVFQVHSVLISLCLQGQEECRAIPTFTLFQISFSPVKIMACQ